MYEAIIGSAITGGLTLIGVIVANNKNQAVANTKIDELTREVREHNNFAQRVPLLEQDIIYIKNDITELKKDDKNN